MIALRRTRIDVEAVLDTVRRQDAGAVAVFLGTVRADPGVRALDYEVFGPMARAKLREVADAARARFGVLAMSIVHRLGHVLLGQAGPLGNLIHDIRLGHLALLVPP